MLDHKCYEIGGDDGSRLVADADHKWFVHDIYGAKRSPSTLRGDQHRYDGFKVAYREGAVITAAATRHMQGALEISAADLPLDPPHTRHGLATVAFMADTCLSTVVTWSIS